MTFVRGLSFRRFFISKLDKIFHFSDDLELLSVKQLKEILMLNRVDFKGCCEKQELKERVRRLWQDHMSAPRKFSLTHIPESFQVTQIIGFFSL